MTKETRRCLLTILAGDADLAATLANDANLAARTMSATPGSLDAMDMPQDYQPATISDSDRDLINNWFSFHPASTPEKINAHELIRDGFRNLAFRLLYLLPPSPDRTVAIRKLREAMYAANATLACNTTDNYDPKARVF